MLGKMPPLLMYPFLFTTGRTPAAWLVLLRGPACQAPSSEGQAQLGLSFHGSHHQLQPTQFSSATKSQWQLPHGSPNTVLHKMETVGNEIYTKLFKNNTQMPAS